MNQVVDSKKKSGKRRSFSCRKTDVLGTLALTLVCIVTVLAYLPGLSGPFLLDDFHNLAPLSSNGEVSSLEDAQRFVFGNGSGPTGRPVALGSFLLDDWSWPSIPYYFKRTNLFLHLACGLMAFLAFRRLFQILQNPESQSRYTSVAILAVSIWMLHPINVSTVLYPVQRMAILAAFFSLATLYLYLVARDPLQKSAVRLFAILGASVTFALGVFSKENAVLVVLLLTVLEVYFLPNKWLAGSVRRVLQYMLPIFVLACISFGLWYFSFESRNFSGNERLFSQIFIVGDYIFKFFFPLVSDFNLVNGDFESLQNAGPINLNVEDLYHLLALICLIGLVWLCVKFGFNVPVIGGVWFFIFHILESTTLPLELYFEHRNYLPSIGLALFIGWAVLSVIPSKFLKIITLSGISLYLLYCLVILSLTWSNPNLLFLKWEMDEPNSVRAKVIYAAHLESRGFPENGLEHIERAIGLDRDSLDLHLRKLRLACVLGDSQAFKDVKLFFENNRPRYSVGVAFLLKELLMDSKRVGDVFCSEVAGGVAIPELLDVVSNSQGIGKRSNEAAQLFALISDYYANKGSFEESYVALQKAIAYTPTFDLYLKLAVMLASAGLYDPALEALEKADSIGVGNMFLPARKEETESLRRAIQLRK